jgi:hypothetical protein
MKRSGIGMARMRAFIRCFVGAAGGAMRRMPPFGFKFELASADTEP